MQLKRLISILLVLCIVLAGTSGVASAHETETIEGYELTFGGSDEPVITDERMWLQVEIVDNETGEPVEGLDDDVEMSVQRPFGNDTHELEVDGVFGEPGLYEGAVVFTEPGTYTVFINATINDTEIETEFSKKVHDRSNLRYPATANNSTEGHTHDQSEEFGNGFGATAATVALGLIIVVLVGRRAVGWSLDE